MVKQSVKNKLHEGVVIPAHPLALTHDKQLDETRMSRHGHGIPQYPEAGRASRVLRTLPAPSTLTRLCGVTDN